MILLVGKAVPDWSWKWIIMYYYTRCWFLPIFVMVWTGIQAVAEVKEWKRGLEPTETL